MYKLCPRNKSMSNKMMFHKWRHAKMCLQKEYHAKNVSKKDLKYMNHTQKLINLFNTVIITSNYYIHILFIILNAQRVLLRENSNKDYAMIKRRITNRDYIITTKCKNKIITKINIQTDINVLLLNNNT